ncbi:delta(3,5)-Delta(2,4)-dienoyl-CoA isomerase, mitochondrial-like [Sycon ciliatum]|uniref:delta(3,5)-Delta(2,4)-dienoyl-CoA isomerase, mitochondrial-like n=1 Tax=Sycon ciliatum TaxID=27933 RepID=UPI0031F718AF
MALFLGRRLLSRQTNAAHLLSRRMASSQGGDDLERLSQFESLAVRRPSDFVVQVELNRPEKRNAMNRVFWKEMVECFNLLAIDENCRVVLLTGAGKSFTGGLDLMDFGPEMMRWTAEGEDVSRKAMALRRFIGEMQETFSVIERCPKPVIAAVHSACIGGGVDMISACDVRYCSEDAVFQIKEVDLGLAADVGTLQRLPKIVGNDSLVRELALTAAKLDARRALEIGLVSRVFPDQPSLVAAGLQVAKEIAARSPVAIQGTKVNLNYARDHSTAESLDFMATWNAAMLQSEDVVKAVTAQMAKTPAEFSKL